jgi:hypothetical protein
MVHALLDIMDMERKANLHHRLKSRLFMSGFDQTHNGKFEKTQFVLNVGRGWVQGICFV